MVGEDVISKRYSCRSFKSTIVSRETISSIVNAGNIAPSSKNRQPWSFIVLNDGKRISELSYKLKEAVLKKMAEDESYDEKESTVIPTLNIMKDVSAIIFIGYDGKPIELGSFSDRYLVDTLSIGACIENMLLSAKEHGLDSLWVCDIFYCMDTLKECLQISEDIVSCIFLGQSKVSQTRRIRKPLESKVRWL